MANLTDLRIVFEGTHVPVNANSFTYDREVFNAGTNTTYVVVRVLGFLNIRTDVEERVFMMLLKNFVE